MSSTPGLVGLGGGFDAINNYNQIYNFECAIHSLEPLCNCVDLYCIDVFGFYIFTYVHCKIVNNVLFILSRKKSNPKKSYRIKYYL